MRGKAYSLLRKCFASSYAPTLKEWRESFLQVWPKIQSLGFDERFLHMWICYLAYCETGFKAGSVDVGHLKLQRQITCRSAIASDGASLEHVFSNSDCGRYQENVCAESVDRTPLPLAAKRYLFRKLTIEPALTRR